MHATSHISNSQSYFSAHEMPIQTATTQPAPSFTIFDFCFSTFCLLEVKLETLQH